VAYGRAVCAVEVGLVGSRDGKLLPWAPSSPLIRKERVWMGPLAKVGHPGSADKIRALT